MSIGKIILMTCLIFITWSCGDTPDQRAREDKDGGKNFVEPGKDDRAKLPPPPKKDPRNGEKRNREIIYWQRVLDVLAKDAEGISAKALYRLSKSMSQKELTRLLNDLPASKGTLIDYLKRQRRRCK